MSDDFTIPLPLNAASSTQTQHPSDTHFDVENTAVCDLPR
jgi:hypothetical protein